MISATIVANVGADPELKFLQDGTAVLSMRVASNSREKVDGDWKDVPTWCSVSIFGKRAESLGKLNLTKGTKIAARGAMKVREYPKNDGSRGFSLEMRADDIELLGGSKDVGARQQQTGSSKPAQSNGGGYGGGGGLDEDVPFITCEVVGWV